ncbi:MAG TPA: hypothetical protein VFG25_06170 [Nitrosopumilaceae archaeon]|nr:hypothetical protein [Nitrosopumilaceae archaeon]
MTLTKKIPAITTIIIIATILLIPQGMTPTSFADIGGAIDPHRHFIDLTLPDDPDYVEDTVGDVKIRAIFHFNKAGDEVVDSFRIINQLGGYGKSETIQFQLLGGVGSDKPKLYTATDRTYELGFQTASTDYRDFDVDVYLFHRGDEFAFRHFMYLDCDISGYSVATLHDGDETFSGKTKFVLADAFTFTCMGFHPHCPICMAPEMKQKSPTNTVSSKDLRNTQTWSDIYRYTNP